MVHWDIFCHVIDNYGDIGVCWRLSRQLAAEYGIAVRLWVDDLASLQRICPYVDASLEAQHCQGVEVRHWVEPFPDLMPAKVVIEAFGCELPQRYVAAMTSSSARVQQQARNNATTTTGEGGRRVWVNLEYLSAEQWVEGCHGLISPHPCLPLAKYFFFPGFTAATGGLLRENDLLAQRDAVQHDSAEIWCRFDLSCPVPGEATVSLFCYDSAPVDNLLDAWASSGAPVRCLLPESKALAQVANWAGQSSLTPGDSVQRGCLTLQILPFLPQEDYDRLLWVCDCNFVRGEDSFVRAQWAARPLVWQIYLQQDDAHHLKLEAFLSRYCQGLAADAAAALCAFHQSWNSGGRPDWGNFWQHHAVLQAHAAAWAGQLAQFADLASNLVSFCQHHGVSKNSSS
ncbi:elongation factor P maturation arginine rhamnosyltransferase EarP [Nitrosomonas communis]|uniref:elongation factor P maturation arginine rhamnosyltransferase EarP n=1 Tax=Nitrosomonas communis TaxID=44574 RepID=UPI0026F2E8C5|nr:elongation factor P maturation arginine rhamnosyltransferase EarP [Nitrosomonas communis]MCO6427829.1 elongation factor P maturation arginine rhamnosyltransferase EarP [Nitrosomonas communis]